MASLKHNLEFAASRLVAGLAEILTMRAADRMGKWLGRLSHALLTSRRRIARDNLAQAFAGRYSDKELDDLTRRVFENFARTTVEIARFGIFDKEKLLQISHGDPSVWKRVLKEGKGGVVVSSHMGNWELIPAWIASHGLEVHVLAGRQHNEKFNRRLINLRRKMGVGIIEIPQEIRRVFKVLKSGGFVALLSDQHATSGAVVLDFFGRPAATPQGPALFSIRTKSPIIPLVCLRRAYDDHVLMTGDPIYPPSTGNEEDDIRTLTESYTSFFEQQIRENPDQWLWTHRRWKAANN